MTRPLHLDLPNAHPGHTAHFTDYRAAEIGQVTISPEGPVEAGAYASFTLVFTAGRFGMDDTGSLRICTRQVSDVGKPQFTDPKAPNYVTAEASNGAKLTLEFNPKLAMRPWSRTLTVTVARGFLSPGDTITIRLGDTRGGSPGLRMQTYCEARFHFLVLADVFATCNWALLPVQPWVPVVPGPAVRPLAILPTRRRPGERFALLLRSDDRWGNPSPLPAGRHRLSASQPVAGLPESFDWPEGARAHRIEGLSAEAAEALVIRWNDTASNPMRVASGELTPYWADLHGQSGETVGTGSIDALASYARDLAGVDAICHQGNDFQITQEGWADFNRAFAGFDQPGRFVFLPGYEWSGNTALGGDRNVIFPEEGRTIRRSCHALVENLTDHATDALDARELHAALKAEARPVLCIPHVGGRYANLHFAHDRMLERAVEVHSDWGTFDWLLHDAFDVGARVGIVANSDGHKGRQGASHPGGSQFGSYGGLTCLLAPELSRAGIFEALRRRHHYATTNAARVHADARASLATPAALHVDDPALGGAPDAQTATAMMGDILAGVADETALFTADILAGSPIERVQLFNRTELLEVIRPDAAPGLRLRVAWEGSEYRGRGRETIWTGEIGVSGTSWGTVKPINKFNLDHRFEADATTLRFQGVTTGGFQAMEAPLESLDGTLSIRTNLVTAEIPLRDLLQGEAVWEAGGLGRRMRAWLMPEDAPRAMRIERRVALRSDADNAIYLRANFEDGSVLWTSPIYLLR
ncbi:DUF3604 domain-containing protein [Roseococcus sp. SDR]|uniref:DUF3604 domain-containing protein n=1 Tax=Roseococcus sp. SDR TaxID=2835532 RepID=UPI001BCB031F|nr:DUF3604 domain-containing protein [Roseococcus sp. SDR]MBS7792007.1 DUF3604 domain-containing protein [Roseococcus sp. SDR]MBV1847321.1 DUF3604 domain-containing protein [Roseococcus sp. SDR]